MCLIAVCTLILYSSHFDNIHAFLIISAWVWLVLVYCMVEWRILHDIMSHINNVIMIEMRPSMHAGQHHGSIFCGKQSNFTAAGALQTS